MGTTHQEINAEPAIFVENGLNEKPANSFDGSDDFISFNEMKMQIRIFLFSCPEKFWKQIVSYSGIKIVVHFIPEMAPLGRFWTDIILAFIACKWQFARWLSQDYHQSHDHFHPDYRDVVACIQFSKDETMTPFGMVFYIGQWLSRGACFSHHEKVGCP